MIFIGMSFSFIDAISPGTYEGHSFESFPQGHTSDINATEDPQNITTGLTANITGEQINQYGNLNMGMIWAIATGGMTVGAIVLSILTGTTNMIGAWIFGSFFWSSWLSLINILYNFDFLDSTAGLILLGMISVGMTIMFVGAMVGMLSGAHSMR